MVFLSFVQYLSQSVIRKVTFKKIRGTGVLNACIPDFFAPIKPGAALSGFILFIYLFEIRNKPIGLIFVLSTLAICLLFIPFIGVAGFHAGFMIGFVLHHFFLS